MNVKINLTINNSKVSSNFIPYLYLVQRPFKSSNFSVHLFWGVDISKFDLATHLSYSIYKIVKYEKISYWKNLLALYDKERIKKTVIQFRASDIVATHSFGANNFTTIPEEFNYYIQTVLTELFDFAKPLNHISVIISNRFI